MRKTNECYHTLVIGIKANIMVKVYNSLIMDKSTMKESLVTAIERLAKCITPIQPFDYMD